MMRWLFAFMISVPLAGPTHAGEVDVGDWELIQKKENKGIIGLNCDSETCDCNAANCGVYYKYFTGDTNDNFEVTCAIYLNSKFQDVKTTDVRNGIVSFYFQIHGTIRLTPNSNFVTWECEDDSWW